MRTLTAHGIVGARTVGPLLDRPRDPRAAQVIVPISVEESGWNSVQDAVGDLRDTATRDAAGLQVHITGPGGYAADSNKAFAGIDGTAPLRGARRGRRHPADHLPQPQPARCCRSWPWSPPSSPPRR